MPLRLRQHLVDLRDLPGMLGGKSIAQERVGFVDDEKGAEIRGLFERRGDGLFRLAEPHRAEIGVPLLEDIEIKALGEMTSIGRLSGAGRTRQAKGQSPNWRPRDLVSEPSEVDVGRTQRRIKTDWPRLCRGFSSTQGSQTAVENVACVAN
jgi:hypothetical protein